MFKDLLGRYPGILVDVLSGSLWVDCLDAPESLAAGTGVTLELVNHGNAFWCHTVLEPGSPEHPDQLHLTWPQTVLLTQNRQSCRVETSVKIHYVVDGVLPPESGVIINLSEGGAALQGEKLLLPGKTVSLFFSPGSGLFLQDIRAEVLRCSRTQDGSWVSGLRFVNLSPEQLQSVANWLLGQTERTTGERRWGCEAEAKSP